MLKFAIITRKESAMDKKELLFISRKPSHPGEILREEFMPDFKLSVSKLASALHVSRQSVNELVHERRALSPEMALRLARFFGTSPQYWLNLQRNVDLWNSMDAASLGIEQIVPIDLANFA